MTLLSVWCETLKFTHKSYSTPGCRTVYLLNVKSGGSSYSPSAHLELSDKASVVMFYDADPATAATGFQYALRPRQRLTRPRRGGGSTSGDGLERLVAPGFPMAPTALVDVPDDTECPRDETLRPW